MSYVPEVKILDGAVDLTRTVGRFIYSFGANIWSSSRGPNLITGDGRLRLGNEQGVWNDEQLSAIDGVQLQVDGAEVCRAKIEDYEYQGARQPVALTLQSVGADDYDELVRIDAATTLDEAALLAHTGVDISVPTAWEGWIVDEGACDCMTRREFVKRFGIHADAVTYEAGDGSFGGILPRTDRRAPTVTISPARHVIWPRDEAESNNRLGWRREGQIGDTLEGNPLTSASRFWDNTGPNRFVRDVIGNSNIIDLGGSGTNKRWKLNVGDWDDGGWVGLPADRSDYAFVRYEIVNGTLFDMIGTNTSGSNPFDVYRVDYRHDGIVSYYVQWSTNNAADYSLDHLTFRRDFRHIAYFGAGSRVSYTLPETSMPTTFLPRLPFPIAESTIPMFQQKMDWWSAFSPAVTRLTFPLAQRSQAAWDEIQSISVGDSVAIEIREPGLRVTNDSWCLFQRWDYRVRDVSTVEMHFLSVRPHDTEIPLYADPDTALDAEAGVPIYVAN